MSWNIEIGKPGSAITGLEWDGNETTNTQRVLRWLSPFAIYDATYIFRVYPKGPKNGSVNPAYWTTFFWGNYGDFVWDAGGTIANTYYGGHPYPWAGVSSSSNQNWEISVYANDYTYTGGDTTSATWNRWYTQVFRAWRESAAITHHEFIYDYDLWLSSSGAQGIITHDINDTNWAATNPPTPCIVVGESQPNNGNTASWGNNVGREQFKGIIRGLQFYDALLTMPNVAFELATPGSARTPWYLKMNPRPDDIASDSPGAHNPTWPASTATLWVGP